MPPLKTPRRLKKRSTSNLHLGSIQCRPWPERLANQFPFSLGMWNAVKNLEFTAQVTILVGENGSGKSTFLEALACAARLVTVGSANVEHDPSLAEVRQLANYLKLNWHKRTHRGFFLRAEDFFFFF